MAVKQGAEQKEVRQNILYYGVPISNFILHNKVSITNEEKKKLGIPCEQKWNELDNKFEEVETIYHYDKMKPVVNKLTGDYLKDEDNKTIYEPAGYKVTKVEFYAKVRVPEQEELDDIATKDLKSRWFTFSIEISDTERPISQNGKYQWICESGHCQWAENQESLKEQYGFTLNGVERARIGEEDLVEKLNTILGFELGTITIDDWYELVSCNFKEINDAIQYVYENHEDYQGFKMLLAIIKTNSDKVYQDIFTKKFDFGAKKTGAAIHKQIESDAASKDKNGKIKMPFEYKGWYNNQIKGLKVYNDELSNAATAVKKTNESKATVTPKKKGNNSPF